MKNQSQATAAASGGNFSYALFQRLEKWLSTNKNAHQIPTEQEKAIIATAKALLLENTLSPEDQQCLQEFNELLSHKKGEAYHICMQLFVNLLTQDKPQKKLTKNFTASLSKWLEAISAEKRADTEDQMQQTKHLTGPKNAVLENKMHFEKTCQKNKEGILKYLKEEELETTEILTHFADVTHLPLDFIDELKHLVDQIKRPRPSLADEHQLLIDALEGKAQKKEALQKNTPQKINDALKLIIPHKLNANYAARICRKLIQAKMNTEEICKTLQCDELKSESQLKNLDAILYVLGDAPQIILDYISELATHSNLQLIVEYVNGLKPKRFLTKPEEEEKWLIFLVDEVIASHDTTAIKLINELRNGGFTIEMDCYFLDTVLSSSELRHILSTIEEIGILLDKKNQKTTELLEMICEQENLEALAQILTSLQEMEFHLSTEEEIKAKELDFLKTIVLQANTAVAIAFYNLKIKKFKCINQADKQHLVAITMHSSPIVLANAFIILKEAGLNWSEPTDQHYFQAVTAQSAHPDHLAISFATLKKAGFDYNEENDKYYFSASYHNQYPELLAEAFTMLRKAGLRWENETDRRYIINVSKQKSILFFRDALLTLINAGFDWSVPEEKFCFEAIIIHSSASYPTPRDIFSKLMEKNFQLSTNPENRKKQLGFLKRVATGNTYEFDKAFTQLKKAGFSWRNEADAHHFEAVVQQYMPQSPTLFKNQTSSPTAGNHSATAASNPKSGEPDQSDKVHKDSAPNENTTEKKFR